MPLANVRATGSANPEPPSWCARDRVYSASVRGACGASSGSVGTVQIVYSP